MKTKKELALKELTEIENRQKELRRIIEEKNIMDRVKTFEDALFIKGLTYDEFYIDFINKNDTKDEIAYKKLKLITSVLNEEWTPNWSDSNENKYFPYFSVGSGFGFSATTYAYSLSAFGSRLCFKSRELSNYAGRQFEAIYKEYLM